MGAVEALDARRYNSPAVRDQAATPPHTLLCGRCATVCDPEDNFCRQCGLPLYDDQLPAVRNGRDLPVVWQPPLPAAVVKGAAFVAAGTVAEFLVRRLVSRALSRRPPTRAVAPREAQPVAAREAPLPDDAQMLSETFFLRRVRFRR